MKNVFDEFMCKYVVRMAITLNCCQPPPAAEDITIGEKWRRGRPSQSNMKA